MFKFKITPDNLNAKQNLNYYVLPYPPLFCYHLPLIKWIFVQSKWKFDVIDTVGIFPITFFLRTTTTSNKCEMLNNLKFVSWKGRGSSHFSYLVSYHRSVCRPAHGHTGVFHNNFLWYKLLALIHIINPLLLSLLVLLFSYILCNTSLPKKMYPLLPNNNLRNPFPTLSIVRHVTGNDKDYLRKIPRVVW